jgi:glutaminase
MRKAAAEGDLATVKRLVQNYAHIVDTRDLDHRTALHLAAAQGQLEVLGVLLEQGADPTLRDRFASLLHA